MLNLWVVFQRYANFNLKFTDVSKTYRLNYQRSVVVKAHEICINLRIGIQLKYSWSAQLKTVFF